MEYSYKQTKTEDLDIVRNFVIQKANGIDKSQLDTVFQVHHNSIHSDGIKGQFQKYFSEIKNNTGILRKNEDKILSKHLSEMVAIASVETWGDSVKEITEKLKSDTNIKAFELEAKSLNKGYNLIGNDISSKDIQSLQEEVKKRNELLTSLNKKHNKTQEQNKELKSTLSVIYDTYKTLVSNLKSKMGLSDKEIISLQGNKNIPQLKEIKIFQPKAQL